MHRSLTSAALAVFVLSWPMLGGEPVKDLVKGSINHGNGKTQWRRVTGKVRVLNATTLEFEDGTRIELDLTVPDPDQMAMNGDVLYPCGKEAAEFLTKFVRDKPVMCFRNDRGEGPWNGYVGDVNLERAMVVNGWALADHSSLHADEIIAREHKRGLWRGKFIHPDDWRAGVRLPGEPLPTPLIDERQAQSLIGEHSSSEAACATLVARIITDVPAIRRLTFPLGSQLTDEGLAQLSGLAALEELYLANCGRITDAGLAHLNAMPGLKRLSLPATTTDAGMKPVANLTSLEELELSWAPISDAGMAHLKDLRRLRRLTLYRIPITDAGLGYLRGNQGLAVLAFGRIPITDAGISYLKEFVNLKYLDIGDTEVTDAGAEQLTALKRLRVLLLPDRITEKARNGLREALPDLKFEGKPEDVLVDPKKVGDSQS